ncbi:hypothetical protein RF11_02273 [Thelohanellus kitauei]|uniref:Uncharacterized protein n=1 Tax=Thelohanellus kitauei TaxID=669202 RepID=A0A0C2IDR7_THEKT|nr:hypothetical protein RF11_02273 [Thelohanellus kitauei]
MHFEVSTVIPVCLNTTFFIFIKLAVAQDDSPFTFASVYSAYSPCACDAVGYQVKELGCVCRDEIYLSVNPEDCTCPGAVEIIYPPKIKEMGHDDGEGRRRKKKKKE